MALCIELLSILHDSFLFLDLVHTLRQFNRDVKNLVESFLAGVNQDLSNRLQMPLCFNHSDRVTKVYM